jgi:hypothetical protein
MGFRQSTHGATNVKCERKGDYVVWEV